jgi:hypothetical protein
MFRQCYEWKYTNRREQTDPRYAPHDYLYGEFSCQYQRVYECLQPAYCTETEPVKNDGNIWRITPFFSFYDEDDDWVTHSSNSAFETIKVISEAGLTPTNYKDFSFSEDAPDFKSAAEFSGRDCDPQYCYYWESKVAWMPN